MSRTLAGVCADSGGLRSVRGAFVVPSRLAGRGRTFAANPVRRRSPCHQRNCRPPEHTNLSSVAHEARSGLEPFTPAELPVPPTPKGLAWMGTVGPGVIVLGASIGSGEFLLGPAAFVQYGLSCSWFSAGSLR